jgi:predicted amidohydrolase/RimJ/RimL family protein N-acetyltransferase
MGNPTIIAAAQMCAEDENIEHNLREHDRLIKLAALNGVRLLIFPEMSITGYVREAADRLAFSRNDSRLFGLKNLASDFNMIIVAGAPVRLGSALHIGAFIISLYTNQFLFKDENEFFMPNCGNNPPIQFDDEIISLAICFDMENKPHILKAAETGSTVYAPGIFFTEGSMHEAHGMLSSYAQTYSLCVMMSNFAGRLYHEQAGGQSAFWNDKGELLACLSKNQTGLVLGIKDNGIWKGRVVVDYKDIYNYCPEYRNTQITLRKTTREDAGALIKCYSDEKAVPLFNSDNCNGDDFHYTSLEQLYRTMDLWETSYNTRRFVRWTVIANESHEGIGTIEMFGRGPAPGIGRFGILRIDLRSDNESRPVIADILEIAEAYFCDAFNVNTILTKAIPRATSRIQTLLDMGYKPYQGALLKHGDYFFKTIRDTL